MVPDGGAGPYDEACAPALAAALVLSACGQGEAPQPAPAYSSEILNVLLISVDTLRADRLNCYGYEAHRVSPHIDALAADGILFENHIAASPWTTPSHMSLLTSLYPTSHGVIQSLQRGRCGACGPGPSTRCPPSG